MGVIWGLYRGADDGHTIRVIRMADEAVLEVGRGAVGGWAAYPLDGSPLILCAPRDPSRDPGRVVDHARCSIP